MTDAKEKGLAHDQGCTIRVRPVVLNVSGPYGVGKDTFLHAIMDSYPALVHRVSTLTTRLAGDRAENRYTTVTPATFERLTALGRWIVNYQLNGSVGYATNLDEIEEAAQQGLVAVHNVFAGDAGAGRLRTEFGHRLVSVGLLAAPGGVEAQREVLRKRLLARGRDDASSIETRVAMLGDQVDYVLENPWVGLAGGEMARVFDATFINDDFHHMQSWAVELFERRFLGGEDG